MFDFGKKISYEDFKPGALEGFLFSCPSEVRRHILLCLHCQDSLEPLFQAMYKIAIDEKIGSLAKEINKDVIKHIKKNRKLNKNYS